MCVHYRVSILVLDVCLVKFCEDILSVVDICLHLVMQEFFLCTQVVFVLVHLFSVGCHLLLCCLSEFVSDSELLLCVLYSFMLFFTVCKVVVSGVVSLFIA